MAQEWYSTQLEIDETEDLIEVCYENGWTDGLPSSHRPLNALNVCSVAQTETPMNSSLRSHRNGAEPQSKRSQSTPSWQDVNRHIYRLSSPQSRR